MSTAKAPMISVIMGIYNCQDTLPEAMDSLLNQSYQDFEIILCNDGSTDNTLAVAKDYVSRFPDKVVLVENEKNMGLNFTLNHCLQHARGKYIARMDGDDVVPPARFQKEVEFLEAHPEYGLVSVHLELFDAEGIWGHITYPIEPTPGDLIKATPFSHGGSMIRKSVMDEVGGYSVEKKLLRVEDRHLWYKIYKAGYRGKNLTDILYSCREDRNTYSRRKFRYRYNGFYVHTLVIREFHLPFKYYLYAVKPLLIGLLPGPVYKLLHRNKLKKTIRSQGKEQELSHD